MNPSAHVGSTRLCKMKTGGLKRKKVPSRVHVYNVWENDNNVSMHKSVTMCEEYEYVCTKTNERPPMGHIEKEHTHTKR